MGFDTSCHHAASSRSTGPPALLHTSSPLHQQQFPSVSQELEPLALVCVLKESGVWATNTGCNYVLLLHGLWHVLPRYMKCTQCSDYRNLEKYPMFFFEGIRRTLGFFTNVLAVPVPISTLYPTQMFLPSHITWEARR